MSSCCYTPSHDGGASLVLVAFMRGTSSDLSYVEVLASMGIGMYCAQDIGVANTSLVRDLHGGGYQDGLYVLECRWHGPDDDDQEFLVKAVRSPNEDEREFILSNNSAAAIVLAWLPSWAGIPCIFCDRSGDGHVGHTLTCPPGDAPGVAVSSYSTDDPLADLS